MSIHEHLNQMSERMNTFIYEKAQQMGDAMIGALDEWMNRITGAVMEKVSDVRESMGNSGLGSRLASLNPIPRLLGRSNGESPELAMGISKGIELGGPGSARSAGAHDVSAGIELPGNEGKNFGQILETSGFSMEGIGHHRSVYGNAHVDATPSMSFGVEEVNVADVGNFSPCASYGSVQRNAYSRGV